MSKMLNIFYKEYHISRYGAFFQSSGINIIAPLKQYAMDTHSLESAYNVHAYCKSKILYTKVSYANSVDPDQTAPSGAV